MSGGNNGQYGSLSNMELEESSEAELGSCPENTRQTGCCPLVFFIVFLVFICSLIVGNFVVAELIL